MSSDQAKQGMLLAVAAYAIWGVAPLYFKLLIDFPASEILMHRVFWSVLVLALIILVTRTGSKLLTAFRHSRTRNLLLITSLLLAGNWLLFIWAINNDHLLDASLGYYINPLFNVFLGRVFLGETLRPIQQVAVGCAVFGVGFMVIAHGELPWIALVLAISFGCYGLLRKQNQTDAVTGLMLESCYMLPLAIGYAIGFATPISDMFNQDWSLNLWLVASGIITTLPLLCFNAAAKRIQYSTLGFIQYLAPTMMFLIAVILFDEPLEQSRLIMFGFVWLGLGIFTWDSISIFRKKRKNKHLAKQQQMADNNTEV